MTERDDIGAEELHAFLDGELSPERRQAVADAAAQDSALAERLARFRADKARIAQTYGALAERPLPAEWITRIEGHAKAPRERSFTQPLMALAATLLLMAAIGIGYWQWRPQGDTIIAEAYAARAQSAQPSSMLAVNSLPALRGAESGMTAALKMRLKAPDLASFGYRLAALKVYDGVPGGKAVELLYRDARHRDLALYVRHAAGPVRFDQFKRNGLRVCIWQDDVIGTVITGKMSAAEMQRLAVLAYRGLEA